MNIPKNYFNQEQKLAKPEADLGPDPLRKVTEVSDSFALSQNDPIIAARMQHQAQPQQ